MSEDQAAPVEEGNFAEQVAEAAAPSEAPKGDLSVEEFAGSIEDAIDVPDSREGGPDDDVILSDADPINNANDIQDLAREISAASNVTPEHREKLGEFFTELAVAKRELDNQYSRVDWVSLKQMDPAQFLMAQSEFNQAYAGLQQKYNSGKAVVEEGDRRAAAGREQFEKEQYQATLRMIPAWNDPQQAASEQATITKWLKNTYGMRSDELNDIRDARVIKLMRDACLADQKLKGKGKAAVRAKRRAKAKPAVDNRPEHSKPWKGSIDEMAEQIAGKM